MSADPIILESKAGCTTLAYSPAGNHLVAGSQDGVIRVYRPPETKVFRAVNGFTEEISSIAVVVTRETTGNGLPLRFWVARGRKIFLYDLGVDPNKLIFGLADALETIVVLDDEDDVLNQISLNVTGTKLAWTSDSGLVGTIDLESPERTKSVLDARHSSISNTVGFIPGWQTELISGGFDCKLQQIDLESKSSVVSKTFGASSPLSPTTSLSPPFVLCTAFSSSGCIAAGTADGRVYIGRKGVVGADGKKLKRKGRWQGLDDVSDGLNFEVGVLEGPVVGIEFMHATKPIVLVISLSGNIQLLSLRPPTARQPAKVGEVLWTSQTRKIAKSNALLTFGAGKWVVVGGVGKTGKGFTEWFGLPREVLTKIG